MYWSLSNVFVNVNSFEDVESKTFIVRLSVERVIELSMPTTSVVLPRRVGLCAASAGSPQRPRRLSGEKAAWGRTPLHYAAVYGRVKAAELLLSTGAAVDAKDNFGPGPQIPGSRRQTSRSPWLGHLRRLFRDWNLCIFRECLAKLWVFRTKKCRDRWSQCNMPICVENGCKVAVGSIVDDVWQKVVSFHS